MASSYYDDSDSRSSRRYDPYSRPRHDSHLRPSAGTSEPRRRSGERAAAGQSKASARQASPYHYRHDPIYDNSDYPPPLPLDTGRPPRPRRSPSRSRRPSWPPQPTCEDEATSLAREAGSQHLLKDIGKDEARSRGKINQDPILEDVPEYINQHERRFVISGQPTRSTDPPTPPTSEDEKARKARRRPSKLDMSFNKVKEDVPEMSKRAASPYAYSRPSTQPKEETSTDRLLSRDALLSPPTSYSRSGHRERRPSRGQSPSPRRERGKYSPSSRTRDDYFASSTNENAVDDRSFEPSRPATYQPARDMPRTTPQTSVVDFAPQPASLPIRRANLDARRNTDTQSTLPTMANLRVDKQRRPTPLMASSTLSDLNNSRLSESPITLQPPADFPPARSRESSYGSSRAVSPAGSAISATSATEYAALPRSPRASGEFFPDRSAESSPTVSRNGSVAGSRPSSPSPRTPSDSPRLPRTDLDWSALMALNAARRPKPSSRLSAPVRQDSVPSTSRVDMKRSPRSDSLPYPMDDGPATPTAWMPSERTHQYFPEMQSSSKSPNVQAPQSLPRSMGPATGQIPPAGTRPTRPSFQARHSTSEIPHFEKRAPSDSPKTTEARRAPAPISSQAKEDLQYLAKKPFPLCTRTYPIPGYTDWYTLVGAPNLDFCPDCIEDIFGRTVFRKNFRRSPPTNLDKKSMCAIGGLPWIRLAWLLTIQRQRADLNLLKDLAEVEGNHPESCPGDEAAIRSWYGIRDADGKFIKNFHICYNDVRKIERLLPTLHGLFVRHPYRVNNEKHICAIRTEGNRFTAYIDILIYLHERASESGKAADPTRFVDCVRRRQRLRECEKDTLLMNGLWHYMPDLPEFTVCEDCYEDVVEPQVRRNNDLAMRFNRTLQPVYREDPIGVSCQLYSKRSRDMFNQALRKKDMKFLARKAKARREAEIRLQEEYKRIKKIEKRLSLQSRESGRSENDGFKPDFEVAMLANEWKVTWE